MQRKTLQGLRKRGSMNSNISKDRAIHREDIHRLQSLSDGVFSIAMTLLVFEIGSPILFSSALTMQNVVLIMPQLIIYFLSFTLLGIYWLGHKNQFIYIRLTTDSFDWLNLIFLSMIAIIPFSAKLFGTHILNPIAISVYGGNLMLIGALLALHWAYAHKMGLLNSKITESITKMGYYKILGAPFCYGVSLIFLIWTPWVSIAVFLAVPLFYIFPGLKNIWKIKL